MNNDDFLKPGPPLDNAPTPTEPTLVSRLTGSPKVSNPYLDTFVGGLDILPYLVAEPAEYFNWPGHPTTVLKIRAGIWQTEPLKGGKTGPLTFPDPAKHFDLHFELQVQRWQRRMALYLHYETNPYFSAAKLRQRVESDALAEYHQRREDFIREFVSLGALPGFQISPGTVQVGKTAYDFNDRTEAEVAAWLRPVLDDVACRVNEVLFKLDLRRRIRTALPHIIDDLTLRPDGDGARLITEPMFPESS